VIPKLRTKLSKIHCSAPVHGKNPTSVIYLTKIGSNPEPGRTPTPRMGLARLSRNKQYMRLQPASQAKTWRFFRETLLDFMSISPGAIFRASLALMEVEGHYVPQNLQLVDSSYLECAQQLSRDRTAFISVS
jgi:hypothetical protein